MGEPQPWPGDVGWPEDSLRAADEAWERLDHALRFAARSGAPTRPIIVQHRLIIEAAILGEPDPRDFNALTFDEQRQAMARYRRQWAVDALAGKEPR
jgi:hypothetical protein